jgi:hypothetical protein
MCDYDWNLNLFYHFSTGYCPLLHDGKHEDVRKMLEAITESVSFRFPCCGIVGATVSSKSSRRIRASRFTRVAMSLLDSQKVVLEQLFFIHALLSGNKAVGHDPPRTLAKFLFRGQKKTETADRPNRA